MTIKEEEELVGGGTGSTGTVRHQIGCWAPNSVIWDCANNAAIYRNFWDSFIIILSQHMNMITLGEQGWALESFFGQDYVTAVRLTSSKKEGGSDAQSPATITSW